MSQRKPIKHPLAQRIVHWFNAASFLFLWLTGIGIITNSGYQIGPTAYVNTINGIFGGAQQLLHAHAYTGIMWFSVLTFSFLLDPHGLSLRFLKDLVPTANDLAWFREKPKAELDPSRPLPEQGAYNAGQKAFGATVLVGSVVIGITGFVMWFGSGGGTLGRWMVLLHLITVGVVIAFFFVHFSMAALMAEERPALKSMIKGDVDVDYIEHHHAEWYREHGEEGQPLRREERFALPRMIWGLLKRLVQRLNDAEAKPLASPYAAGVGLGISVLGGFMILGHGPGASGFFSRLGAFGLAEVAPDYVATNAYWGPVLETTLWGYWLTWGVLGIAVGGFISALLAGRIKFGIDHGPHISPKTRLLLALVGGMGVGIATRLTRGCTSHHLSSGALLAVGSWAFLVAVFVGGFLAALSMKRVWR